VIGRMGEKVASLARFVTLSEEPAHGAERAARVALVNPGGADCSGCVVLKPLRVGVAKDDGLLGGVRARPLGGGACGGTDRRPVASAIVGNWRSLQGLAGGADAGGGGESGGGRHQEFSSGSDSGSGQPNRAATPLLNLDDAFGLAEPLGEAFILAAELFVFRIEGMALGLGAALAGGEGLEGAGLALAPSGDQM